MNKKIYVEFIGMPGSGKTFFQKKLIKKLKYNATSNNFLHLNKMQKIFYIIKFALNYKFFFFKTLFFLFKIKKKNKLFKRYLYYFYNEIAFRSFFENNKKYKYLINSEGFYYRSSYYFNNKIDISLKKYLKTFPYINLLVFVKSKKSTDINRTIKRKNGFTYSEEDKRGYEKKKKFLLDSIKHINNKNTKILKINNTKNKYEKESISKIINFLLQ